MIIEGKSVFLRFPDNSDVDLLLLWENDSQVWEVGDNKEEYTRKEIQDFIKNGQDLNKFEQMRFMICSQNDKRAIGCIDLYEFNENKLEAGIGILVYSNEDRNSGFGSEALSLLIDFSKDKLRLNNLFCRVIENNNISKSLFLKKGFTLSSVDDGEITMHLHLS